MCYLKNLSQLQNLDSHIWNFKEEECSENTTQGQNFLELCNEKAVGEWKENEEMVVKILEMVERNNRLILKMKGLLSNNSQQVGKLHVNTQNYQTHPTNYPKPSSLNSNPTQMFNNHCSSLAAKLFGPNTYKFRLEVSQELSHTLYKERNFGIELRLVNHDGKIVKNCNLVTLNFAICTMDAKWLHENRIGEPFLKGKTEVDLYKGEASFHKVYARDISRGYFEGKVAIGIYPKPSTLKYYTEGPNEHNVDSEQIQPLVIEDITIKAKRKQ